MGDYSDHWDQGMYNGRTEIGVGNWGRQWVTRETMRTSGYICRGRTEKSRRLGESTSYACSL